MAITLYRQANQHGRVDMRDPVVDLEWLVKATGADKITTPSVEAAVEVAVYAGTPSTYSGLTRASVDIQELGNGIYSAKIQYKLLEGAPIPARTGVGGSGNSPAPSAPAETDALDETYSFRTGGGTKHITQSLTTLESKRRGGGTPPDFRGAIGVNKDRIEGCDIYEGKLEFSMTKQIPQISLAYIKTLRNLTGTVNGTSFYSHAAGELLFLGATGQTKGPESALDGNGGWTVTFDFAESPNLEDIVLVDGGTEGESLIIEEKGGWDYLWVLYEPAKSENTLGQVPLAAYVEQVYSYTDFSLLGIG